MRELDRLIKKLCSKAARSLVETNEIITFNADNIEKYLGPRKFMARWILIMKIKLASLMALLGLHMVARS